MSTDSLGTELDAMAALILADAQGAPLETKIDAFKAVTAYYVQTHKIRPTDDDNAPGVFNFGNAQSRLKTAANS